MGHGRRFRRKVMPLHFEGLTWFVEVSKSRPCRAAARVRSVPAMVEATIQRRRAAATMVLLALCAVAAAVLSVRAAKGGLSAAGGATVLVSKPSGTKLARVQLAGDDGGDGNDDDEEEEEPPYGETTELPDPACDIEALQNCLGAMQALEESLPEAERELLSGGEDSEIAHEFCKQAKGHFQCACQACDLSKLSTWNNDYWTKDRCVFGGYGFRLSVVKFPFEDSSTCAFLQGRQGHHHAHAGAGALPRTAPGRGRQLRAGARVTISESPLHGDLT